jgi:hypothetical protein
VEYGFSLIELVMPGKKGCLRMKTMFVYMVFVTLLSGAPQILAQQGPKPKAQESGVKDLRTLSGELVVEGRNKTPAGPLKLLTYKLEEVALPQPS